jgi:multisubunit Na+/H+ antiporter MnhE subunit
VTGVAVRAAALAAIYLLVLTSVKPFDILLGLIAGGALALALRPRTTAAQDGRLSGGPVQVAGAFVSTGREMIVGSWRVARFCLGLGSDEPGFVEIPRGDRTRGDLALWGLLTGEAPDEVPVEIDEQRGVLLVHLVDASDPEAVRERHRLAHERMRRR